MRESVGADSAGVNEAGVDGWTWLRAPGPGISTLTEARNVDEREGRPVTIADGVAVLGNLQLSAALPHLGGAVEQLKIHSERYEDALCK